MADERTATDVAEELYDALVEWNAALRTLLGYHDPPPPGRRERHLHLVESNDA